jgi:hypothetical protein
MYKTEFNSFFKKKKLIKCAPFSTSAPRKGILDKENVKFPGPGDYTPEKLKKEISSKMTH